MIHKTLQQVRTALEYTQEQMAELLGISRPTYADIEKGKGEVTVASLEKLAKRTGLSLNSLLTKEDIRVEAENQEALKKYKTMVLYMLSCGADNDGKITKTKLAKLLYLADFGWFYKHLASMSGLTYRRIQYGPVPDQYFRALEELVEENQIKIEAKDAHMISASEKTPPTYGLSKDEQILIKDICKRWKGKNTKDIVDFTHNQLPWKLCKDNELIPYELIIQEDPEYVY
jgi:transcriptional regulator with XRE-family HTH domain